MTAPWAASTPPDPEPLGVAGWSRVLLRGPPLAGLVFGGLLVLLALRAVEAPVFGLHRPATPHITRFVCRNAFRILGIRFVSTGEPMTQHGIVVSNHASWLDIFALNARKRIYYVAKTEVAGWLGIGWLARATGTVFIDRDRRQAAAQTRLVRDRLGAGHKLLFFPEGTSTDGLQVLAFKPTLFAAVFESRVGDDLWVQPVAVGYTAPPGQDHRFYAWWGDMDFAPHLLQVLAARRQGAVRVTYCAPLRGADFADRKAIASAAERAVRAAHGASVPA